MNWLSSRAQTLASTSVWNSLSKAQVPFYQIKLNSFPWPKKMSQLLSLGRSSGDAKQLVSSVRDVDCHGGKEKLEVSSLSRSEMTALNWPINKVRAIS